MQRVRVTLGGHKYEAIAVGMDVSPFAGSDKSTAYGGGSGGAVIVPVVGDATEHPMYAEIIKSLHEASGTSYGTGASSSIVQRTTEQNWNLQ